MSISPAFPRPSPLVLPDHVEGIAHLHDGSFSSAEVIPLSRLSPQWHESLLRLSRPVSSPSQHSSQADSISAHDGWPCNAAPVHLKPPPSPCSHTAPRAARTPEVERKKDASVPQQVLPLLRAPA